MEEISDCNQCQWQRAKTIVALSRQPGRNEIGDQEKANSRKCDRTQSGREDRMYPMENKALADATLRFADNVNLAHDIGTTILDAGFRACFVRVTIRIPHQFLSPSLRLSGWRMSLPLTMNTTSSARLVAWSAMRSRYLAIDCNRVAR